MAISFMAILAITIEERVDRRAGAILLWPLIAIGIASLLVWRWTGDLRLYAWVQFFPCLALPLIFLLFAPKFSGTIYWLIAARLYFKRAYSQTSRRCSRLWRDPGIFSETPADRRLECRRPAARASIMEEITVLFRWRTQDPRVRAERPLSKSLRDRWLR